MLLLVNGTILTQTTQGNITSGYVLIDGSKIVAVGAGTAPDGYTPAPEDLIIDVSGKVLLPGLIDAHNHVGLFDDGLDMEGDDGNEITDPITPQLRAIDGIYHADRCFIEALSHGITTVMTGPGSANVIGGQFALLNTFGESTDQMAQIPIAAMKAALGENPKRCYSKENKSPATRMATAALLREAFFKATEYRDLINNPDCDDPDFDLKWESMQPVLDGSLPLKIHAHRADDILTAIRIANEFGLSYTIDHCTEGYLIVDQLKKIFLAGQEEDCGIGNHGKGRLLGIVAGPLIIDRSKPELVKAELRNPAIISAAGIPVALMSDHPANPVQYLPVYAALAVREGMSEAAALSAITDSAARLCGVGNRLGRLAENYQADIAVFSGHPLDTRSVADIVVVKGKVVFQRSIVPAEQ
jgi:imidazolonepropionase-like amidohydrolase